MERADFSRSEPLSNGVRCPRTGLHLFRVPLRENLLTKQWRDLASRALIQNIFYEEEYAVSAAIPFGDGVELLVVTEDASPTSRMLGLWPVRVSRHRWGVPLPVLTGWTHPFAPLGVPLLDRDHAEGVLSVLLRAASLIPGLPARTFMPNVPEQGPFPELLNALTSKHALRSCAFNLHDRAKLDPQSREKYFESNLSSRTRSKLRQEMRRIERDGRVEFETISEAGAIADAIEDYIQLEGRGWKARVGTAVSCSPTETEFLRRVARALSNQGRIRIHRLKLDGTTLASSVTYFSASMAWYSKISFDESQAKNSPGSQLVMYATEELLRDPSVMWVDSCAPPGHPLMKKFWSESLSISNRIIDASGADPFFRLAVELERLRLKTADIWTAYKGLRRARLKNA
jgi:CelD/BcsL family acetyltransferase involved in cellulose biosynthesis